MSTYSVKIKYQTIQEGKTINHIEQHIMSAVNATDAEVKITTLLKEMSISDFKLQSLSEYKLTDVIKDPIEDANRWWEVKVCYQLESDKGKIQKTYENNLVFTRDAKNAIIIMENILKQTSLQWDIENVRKTMIVNVDTENIKELAGS